MSVRPPGASEVPQRLLEERASAYVDAFTNDPKNFTRLSEMGRDRLRELVVDVLLCGAALGDADVRARTKREAAGVCCEACAAKVMALPEASFAAAPTDSSYGVGDHVEVTDVPYDDKRGVITGVEWDSDAALWRYSIRLNFRDLPITRFATDLRRVVEEDLPTGGKE